MDLGLSQLESIGGGGENLSEGIVSRMEFIVGGIVGLFSLGIVRVIFSHFSDPPNIGF